MVLIQNLTYLPQTVFEAEVGLGPDEVLPLGPNLIDSLQEVFPAHGLVIEGEGEAPVDEDLGIVHLIPSGTQAVGDQDHGLAVVEEFEDGIGPGSGDDEVGHGQGMVHVLTDKLHLTVAGAVELLPPLPLAHTVKDIESVQKGIQIRPNGLIDPDSPGRPPKDQKDGPISIKAENLQALFSGSFFDLVPDDGA